ncbi:MAG: nucleotidyltransferase family protein [Pseudomonadota bacterium]
MTDALILAAGRGERLRPMTDTLPKPLIEVGGEPLIDHHLRTLSAAGITRVVINLGWLGEQIASHVGDGSQFGVRVLFSPEGYPTLDTGGAIVRALPLIGTERFWVINADIWMDYVPSALDPIVDSDCTAAIGLTPNPVYRSSGDFAINAGRAANAGAEMMTFSGIARYRRDFFAGLPDGRFSIVPLLRAAADAHVLGAFDIQSRWFDIGTPDRLATARAGVTESQRQVD